MILKLVRRVLLDLRITLRPRVVKFHLLSKQLKVLHILDGLCRALRVVEHDERLAFALERALCDDVEDCAIFGEDLLQRFDELRDLDALFEVADLETVNHAVQCGGHFREAPLRRLCFHCLLVYFRVVKDGVRILRIIGTRHPDS